jgi:hypothetical protein
VLLSLDFNIDSKPTDSQVTDIIALISSEINLMLISVGIGLPTVGSDLYNVVKLKTMQGSAGTVALTYYVNTADVPDTQGDYYLSQYTEFLTMIKEKPELFKSVVYTAFIENHVTGGVITEDGVSDIMIGDDWTA